MPEASGGAPELQKRLEAVQRELAEKQQEESAGMGRLEALEDQIQAELELPGTEAGLKSGKAMENELEDLDAALSKIQAELEVNRKKLLRREQLEKAAEETERLSEDCQKQAGDKRLLLARMDAERASLLGSIEEKKAVLGALTREENRRKGEEAWKRSGLYRNRPQRQNGHIWNVCRRMPASGKQ